MLETRALSLGFAATPVLSDVSLSFPQGSITALLGPTGSGKTTFLRSLNRMNDRVSGFTRTGDVLLDGRSIWDPGQSPLALRRKIGMLFQRPNPFPMSIFNNVVSAVRAHKIAAGAGLRQVAEQRLREVGLWDAVKDRLGDSPFRLSGGQQQLLCLARALAVGPEVLLLDEPTSSLDPISTAAIEGMIRGLAPALTVVIVTHNLAQARRVADRTAFFYQGHLIEAGPTDEVFERPQREETAHYVTGRIG
ncbi:MAG: phosphate ABC transporter ATP-binding protein [Mycobacteriales bacterium]